MQKDSVKSNCQRFFKSTSIQLTAALLTVISEATFAGFEDDPIDKNKKVILISYPRLVGAEVDKVLNEFDKKILSVNLFYYNRNLNFLRDRLFSKRTERR